MSLSRLFSRELRPMLHMLEEGPFPRTMYQPLRGHPSGRYDPFASFERDIAPAVDVTESDDSYVLHAELPGIKKEHLNLRVGDEGRSLTISITGRSVFHGASPAAAKPGTLSKSEHSTSVESSETDAQSPGTVQDLTKASNGTADSENATLTRLYNERTFAGDRSFSRTVHLPYPVDTKGIIAKLEDGVLTVKAQKMQEHPSSTEVPIN